MRLAWYALCTLALSNIEDTLGNLKTGDLQNTDFVPDLYRNYAQKILEAIAMSLYVGGRRGSTASRQTLARGQIASWWYILKHSAIAQWDTNDKMDDLD